MASLDEALALARQGFHIFPLQKNSKLPAIKAWQEKATTDEKQITDWWQDPVMGLEEDWNIGICTTRFNCEEALLAVDVDNKGDKRGSDEIIKLELQGYEFPVTRVQSTPTGGEHIIYRVREPLSQGVDVLAKGLDIRSRGGYVVAEGSTLGEGRYSGNSADIASAPEWLVELVGGRSQPARTAAAPAADIDRERAAKRAVEYLRTANTAVEGDGGDHTTYLVAAKLKDLGVDEVTACDLMAEWNERCDPPWSPEELETKVANAYRYGKNEPGVDAPEAQFESVQIESSISDLQGSPVERMNKEYAFIKYGAFILSECVDHHGRFDVKHISPSDLHAFYANKRMQIQVGKKIEEQPISKVWMGWAGRREYESVVFSPEKKLENRYYNLWRGFAVQPSAPFTERERHPALNAFIEHALENVCNGDHALFNWLMGYFAHLIQRPYEKPLVALVFKGDKGTGKNALIERVGHLLGGHFMVADDDRYLLGNFNSHLESCLFLVLDEAAWAGDKRAEGRLKGLITGSTHNIERKGEEVYKTDNLTRVAMIGNEAWMVPATVDERRFAVFNVGNGRRQDRQFFEAMRVGMEQGGYAHLLRYLMDFPISDVNAAPDTKGLMDQKLESLQPFETWWLGCLRDESILGSEMEGWPDTILKKRVRDSLYHWLDKRGIRNWKPSEDTIGKRLRQMGPSIHSARRMENGHSHQTYKLPSVETLRAEFSQFLKGEVDWG